MKIEINFVYKIVNDIIKLCYFTTDENKKLFLTSGEEFALNFFILVDKKISDIPSFAATFINNVPVIIFPENIKVWKKLKVIDENDNVNYKKFLAILQHEIQHLVRLHPFRAQKYNPTTYNIIADALINSQLDLREICNEAIYLEDIKQQFNLPYKISELKRMTVEEIIEQIQQQKFNQPNQNQQTQNNQNQNTQSNQNKQTNQNNNQQQNNQSNQNNQNNNHQQNQNNQLNQSQQNQSSEDNLSKKTFDQILEPENSNETSAAENVKKIIDHVKQIGNVPNSIEEIIKNWRFPPKIVLPTNDIEITLQKIERSYIKPSQYNIVYPNSKVLIPAYPMLTGAEILVIIDTSASINSETAELFFGFLKKLSEKYIVYYTEIDTEIKFKPEKFNKNADEIKFIGRGGTSFKNIEKLKTEYKFKSPNIIIILTDGYVEEFPKNVYPNAKWFMYVTEKVPENLPNFIKLLKIEKQEVKI